ncbi:hypothetical protein MMC12_004747 [Toensbergia leucococca]|nr:hypothetical protein [Toensbergia leucococca]
MSTANITIDPAMQAAITAGIAQYLRENPLDQGPPGPPDPPGPPGNHGQDGHDAAEGDRGSRWNPGDLGFFDPMYDGKSVNTLAHLATS